MKPEHPKISVVIPAYNEAELLPACLEAVIKQSFPKNDYEIIVVNNASTDGTARVAKLKGVKVVSEKRKGLAMALREGVNMAQGEIVAITEADSQVPPDWLFRINQAFRNDPKLEGYGGVYAFFDGSFFVRKVIPFFSKLLLADFVGLNMSFRKRAYDLVGGFDPRVSMGADALLSRKIRKVGRVKIDHSLVVSTSARRFKKALFRTLMIYNLNWLFLVCFHRPLFFGFADIRTKPS